MYSGRYHFDVPNTFLFVFFLIVIFTHLLSFPVSYNLCILNIYYLYDIGLILGSIKYRIIHANGK